MYLSKPIFLSLISLAVAMPVLALEKNDAANPVIETLLVKGYAQTPLQNLDTTKKSNFLSGSGHDIADFAQAIPGLQVDSRSNYAQDTRVSFRGFGSRSAFGIRGIKLYQDGVPLSMPDGQGQLSSVVLDRVESVSVVRGPLAVLYGAGAGGVVFIESSPVAKNQAALNFAIGEDGFRKKAVDLEAQQDNVWGKVYYADFENQGIRAHSFTEREQWSVAAGFSPSHEWNFSLSHEVSKDPLLQDPLGLSYEEWKEDPWQVSAQAEQMNTRKSIENEQTSLRGDFTRGNFKTRAALWRGERQVTQYLAIPTQEFSRNGGVVDFDRKFRGATIALSHESQLAEYVWINTLGAEWSWMEDDRRGYVNLLGVMGDLRRDELNEVNSSEVYGISQLYLNPSLQIYMGLRASDLEYQVTDFYEVINETGEVLNPDDSGKKSFDFTSFSLGFKAALSPQWQTGLGFGRGYEAPTFSEMAYSKNNQGFNFLLDQSSNDQWQWDLAYSGNNYELSASVFHINSQDELVVESSDGGRTTYRNAGETERRGAELAGTWRPHEKWDLNASTGYIDARFDEAAGDDQRMPGVASVQHHLEVRYRPWASPHFYTTVTGHHRSKVYVDDANILAAPSYTRWDLGLGGEVDMGRSEINWWLKLRNFTDESFVGSVIVNQSNGRSFEPAPPKQLMIGVELRL